MAAGIIFFPLFQGRALHSIEDDLVSLVKLLAQVKWKSPPRSVSELGWINER